MLVLTRKPREEIRIGNGIKITVLRVKGQSVRIGIEAPDDVRIIRSELDTIEDDSASSTNESVGHSASTVFSARVTLPASDCSEVKQNRLPCADRHQRTRRAVNSTLRMLAARRRESLLTESISAASQDDSTKNLPK